MEEDPIIEAKLMNVMRKAVNVEVDEEAFQVVLSRQNDVITVSLGQRVFRREDVEVF